MHSCFEDTLVLKVLFCFGDTLVLKVLLFWRYACFENTLVLEIRLFWRNFSFEDVFLFWRYSCYEGTIFFLRSSCVEDTVVFEDILVFRENFLLKVRALKGYECLRSISLFSEDSCLSPFETEESVSTVFIGLSLKLCLEFTKSRSYATVIRCCEHRLVLAIEVSSRQAIWIVSCHSLQRRVFLAAAFYFSLLQSSWCFPSKFSAAPPNFHILWCLKGVVKRRGRGGGGVLSSGRRRPACCLPVLGTPPD